MTLANDTASARFLYVEAETRGSSSSEIRDASAARFDEWLSQIQAEAWDEGFQAACDETPMDFTPDGPTTEMNPYRIEPGVFVSSRPRLHDLDEDDE